MAILYKYYDSYFKDLIINPKLKLTPPSHLNDPFERKVPCGLESIIINFFKHDDIIDDEDIARTIAICESETNRVGITAMTEKHNNILMWSHYANSHRGVCIGYDTEKISSNTMSLEKIAYLENRFDESDLINNSVNLANRFAEVTKKVLTTKSPEWKYEKEYRYLTHLTDAHEIAIKAGNETDEEIYNILNKHNQNRYLFDEINTDSNGITKRIKTNHRIELTTIDSLINYHNVSFYRSISQDSIKSVHIGCNSEVRVGDVMNDIKEAELTNINVYKYRISDYKFKLEIDN